MAECVIRSRFGKAVFVMLAFYNFHCLGYLMASSIYEKVMNVMMKSIDFLQDSYLQEVNCCMAVGMFCLTFSYSVLFVAMTLILYRLMKDVMGWRTCVMWQRGILAV